MNYDVGAMLLRCKRSFGVVDTGLSTQCSIEASVVLSVVKRSSDTWRNVAAILFHDYTLRGPAYTHLTSTRLHTTCLYTFLLVVVVFTCAHCAIVVHTYRTWYTIHWLSTCYI